MAAAWQISGDYFENCNCNVVCPCLVSKSAPLTSRPTEGVCDVALLFHIDKGSYQSTALDDLNVALAAWVRWKYKRFRRRDRASIHWLGRIARRDPQLFVLWQLGVKPEAGL